MPEYLLFGDPHFSDRPPSSCTDTYLDDMFALLAAIRDEAAKRTARAVICAGDWFHHKTPGRTTFSTVIRTINALREFPCPVYVTPGNHDMTADRLDSIDRTQPLGAVIASGALKLLCGWMDITDELDRSGWLDPIYGVPWLQTFDDDSVNDALRDYRDFGDDEYPHQLVVTHAPLYPLGQEFPREFYPADKWAAAMENNGAVYYGHIHTPHGIHTAAGVTFCNPGALSRGSLHEYNLTRPIQIASWSSETGAFEIVPLPHKPATEVFRLAEAQEAKTSTAAFDRFLDHIGRTTVDIVSVESVMEHVRGMDLEPPVEKKIDDLLTEGTP